MLEQKFIGKINTDDADRDLEEAVRDALNLVPQDGGLGTTSRRENVKGNVAVLNELLPIGTNKTIGQFTDKNNQRVIYFNYNSNNNHGIFVYEKTEDRIYRVVESSLLNWSDETIITGAGIIKDQLIWTDTNSEIRTIDIRRGKNTFDVNQKRRWEILLGDSDSNFNVEVTKSDGSQFSISVNRNNIESSLNGWASVELNAEKCENTVIVREENRGEVSSITVTGVNAVAPRNIYSNPITDRQMTLVNYPLPCPPTVEFQTDTTRTNNFVIDDSFQFSVRYVYFDDSFSTISPYSKIIAKKDCGVSSPKIDNYIEVTFNENQYTQDELMLIKNVEILFRNGNSGNFYKAVSLDRDEFFNGSYDFYNDGAYETVDSATVAKPFDAVPNKANALTVLKNRLFIGGYTEGYGTPCVDANLTVDLEEGVGGVGNTWEITGRVRIVNKFLQPSDNQTTTHWNQPIHSRSGDIDRESWVYGGMGARAGFNGAITNGGSVTAGNHNLYGQFIPEGGFTVFLAGTNYFDISKQITKSYSDPVDNDAEVVSEDPIVFKTDENGGIFGGVIDPNNEYGRTAVRRIMEEENVYSTFTIKGVPPGKYILRVASPLCARDENMRSDVDAFYSLDGNIANWQSTSANVVDINGNVASHQENRDEYYPEFTNKELIIDLGDEGGTFDIHDGDDSRAILIADLTDTADTGNSVINQGYLIDAESLDEEGFAASLRMEKQRIAVSKDESNITNTSDFQIQTDHNGAWWAAWKAGFLQQVFPILGGNPALIRTLTYNGGTKNTTTFPILSDVNQNNNYEIKHWNQEQYIDTDISDVYNGNIIGQSQQKDWSNNNFNTKWIMYNNNSRVRDYGRVIVQGKVVDTEGNPLGDLFTQITQTNRNEKTDGEGFFNIIVYADRDLTLPEMARPGTVFIGKGTNACVSFSDKSVPFDARPIYADGVNSETPYEISDIVIDDLVVNTSSRHKRGGVYHWGLVYFDLPLRSSFVATSDSLRRRIPFTTDDLGATLPDQYASPTFKYGSPVISWEINSQPPEWAHYYQWVRTKDTAHQTFFTWSANDVLYVKEWDLENEEPITTTFNSSEANEVYLDISNLQDYINANSDAQLGYNFSPGDRCILIKNEGEFFENYIDVEVKGQRGDYIIIENTGSLVELKGGLLFQVYTPKLQNETEIFYEIGECYPIDNPGTDSRAHSVPSGTFTSGDAYSIGRNVTTDVGAVTEDYEHPTIADKETVRFSDIGRPNIINKNAKSEYFFSSVRFSNPFIQNAYDNGLSSFDPLDKEDLPLDRGPINKMIGTTNVILALHNTEATSLYVGEGFLHTADGGGLESKTDKIIADERLLKGEYGTINPESVVEYDDVVYWWDQNKGEIIRYSNNGLTPLGLVEKYRNKLLDIQKYQKVNTVNSISNSVYGGYNPIWDMALMTFKNINGEDITVGFHERSDSFVTRFSFVPELYSYIDTKLYSFKDGVLYEHDVNDAGRNTFYGVQYPSRVHFVSNMNNELEKIYRSIGIKSNQPWSAPLIFNKDGQESNLIVEDFIRRDDMYYANILRDINTAADKLIGNQVPLRSGDVMRSQVMEIILENNDNSEVELDFITVDFQESPGHLINR